MDIGQIIASMMSHEPCYYRYDDRWFPVSITKYHELPDGKKEITLFVLDDDQALTMSSRRGPITERFNPNRFALQPPQRQI